MFCICFRDDNDNGPCEQLRDASLLAGKGVASRQLTTILQLLSVHLWGALRGLCTYVHLPALVTSAAAVH